MEVLASLVLTYRRSGPAREPARRGPPPDRGGPRPAPNLGDRSRPSGRTRGGRLRTLREPRPGRRRRRRSPATVRTVSRRCGIHEWELSSYCEPRRNRLVSPTATSPRPRPPIKETAAPEVGRHLPAHVLDPQQRRGDPDKATTPRASRESGLTFPVPAAGATGATGSRSVRSLFPSGGRVRQKRSRPTLTDRKQRSSSAGGRCPRRH